MTVDVTTLFSKAARNGPPTPGGKPMQHADRPIAYNFDSGLAAEETFPIDDFARIGTEVIARDGAAAFEYGNSDYNELVYGYPELRDQIAARILARDGRDLGPGRHPSHLRLGAGHRAGHPRLRRPRRRRRRRGPLLPLCPALHGGGGGTVLGVPVDDDGMVVEGDRVPPRPVRKGRNPPQNWCTTISTFQLPTGSCMSVERP